MKFKIDENLPAEVAGLLRKQEHDAVTVLEQHLGGSPDSNIAVICQQEGRALVTLDIDFADIRFYPPEQYPGIIVLRLERQDKPHVLDIFAHVMEAFSSEPIKGRLWIVEEKQIRIRE